jgi:hypothetical protein
MKKRILIIGLITLVLILSPLLGGERLIAQVGRCQVGAISLSPSSNWAAVLNANPPGTEYCLSDGTYSGFSVRPENGDRFTSQNLHGAILDGNNVTTHAFSNDFQFGTVAQPGAIVGVIIDGFVIRRYYTNNAYGQNQAAIDAFSGWQILNNRIEDNVAGVIFSRANWSCARAATAAGLFTDRRIIIDNNDFVRNGYVSLYYQGTQATITNNDFINNAWGAVFNDARYYGHFKILNNAVQGTGGQRCNVLSAQPGDQVIVAYNYFAANQALGLWSDEGVGTGYSALIENNVSEFNSWFNIVHELSDGAIIRNNRTRCARAVASGLPASAPNDAGRFSSGWSGAEFALISSDNNTTVSNNFFQNCLPGTSLTAGGRTMIVNANSPGRGIVVMEDGGRVAEYKNTSGTFTGNIVQLASNSDFAFATFDYSGDSGITALTIAGNAYYVPTLGGQWYFHQNAFQTFTQWRAFNFDTIASGSTENLGSPPGQPTNTPTPTTNATTTNTPVPTATSTAYPSQPYPNGVAHAVPGRLQMENFDGGAAGFFEADGLTDFNAFGNVYRFPTGVDIKPITAGYAVGYFAAGDWMQYTVNVATTGYYSITLSASEADAAAPRPRQVRLSSNSGATTLAIFNVVAQTDWAVYAPTTVTGVYMTSGTRVLRVESVNGYSDIDYLDFVLTGTQTPTFTPSPTPSGTTTTTRYEAETYTDAASGITIYGSADPLGGGSIVGEFNSGRWISFNSINLESGVVAARLRAEGGGSGTFSLRTGSSGGPAFCTFSIVASAYTTFTGTCNGSVSGTQTIWLTNDNTNWANINWFELDTTSISATNTPTNTPTPTNTFTPSPTFTATITPTPLPTATTLPTIAPASRQSIIATLDAQYFTQLTAVATANANLAGAQVAAATARAAVSTSVPVVLTANACAVNINNAREQWQDGILTATPQFPC